MSPPNDGEPEEAWQACRVCGLMAHTVHRPTNEWYCDAHLLIAVLAKLDFATQPHRPTFTMDLEMGHYVADVPTPELRDG